MKDESKIIWKSYEFEYKEKTADWFWAVSIITLSLAAIAIIYNNFLFALFMFIGGFTIFAIAKKPPRLIEFELNSKGVKVDGMLYPYAHLKSFWVEEDLYTVPKLILKTEKFITPIIVIPIESYPANHEDVRNLIIKSVKEEKLHQPLSHRLTEILGL